jgi:hypothetical protein
MSASSTNNGISIRRMPINDMSQLPLDYSTTPGGTFFSTTPGGSRIIYDKKFLLSRQNTPYAQTPPTNLPYIPEITLIPPKETPATSGVSIISEVSKSSLNRQNSRKLLLLVQISILKFNFRLT